MNINELGLVSTSHDSGTKRVLIDKYSTETGITQIAVAYLKKGDVVETHIHPTMEECFLVRKGTVKIVWGERCDVLSVDDFIKIDKNTGHSLEAVDDCEMLVIGAKTE